MKSLGMWAMVCLAAFIIGKTAKTEKKEVSDVAKANVEALADGEATGPCKGLGYVYCTYNGYWVEYQLKN